MAPRTFNIGWWFDPVLNGELWCRLELPAVLIHLLYISSLSFSVSPCQPFHRGQVLLLHGDIERRCYNFFKFCGVFHSSKCAKGLQVHCLFFDGLHALFHAPWLQKFVIFRNSENEHDFFDLCMDLRCIEPIN